MTPEAANRVTCPGLPADWINGWLAAVGATVLDPELQLSWTTDPTPVAVLEHPDQDPAGRLIEAWPTHRRVGTMPLARSYRTCKGTLTRQVSVDDFAERVREASADPETWTLTSTMTDLAVDKGRVANGRFDPPVPRGFTLHDRLVKTHNLVNDPSERIPAALAGAAVPVEGNGLGFDIARLSLREGKKFVDPVVEVFAFFGLRLFPVRGDGVAYRDPLSRQRGWRVAGDRSGFKWPAWNTPLDADAIDALLDEWHSSWRLHKVRNKDKYEWKPDRAVWSRLGVHAAWESTRYMPDGSAESNRGYGSRPL